MVTMNVEDELCVAVVEAIHTGDVEELRALLEECPWLAGAWIDDSDRPGTSRSLLHVLTDWPGHRPRGAETVAALAGPAPWSTPRSAARTARRRCTGPRAATTSRSWTPCSTPAPTSRHPAPCSAAGPRWPTPAGSSSGTPRTGWSNAARAPPCSTPPCWD